MKRLVNYLLQGLLYIAPLGITAYIIYTAFMFMDGLLQKYFVKYLGNEIPGLGLLSIIVLLIIVGYIGSSIVARPFKYIYHKVINKIPLIKFIHSAFKDLFTAFVGKEKKFKKPVLVKVNKDSDLERIGFLTEEDLDLLHEKDKVAVYFPFSYTFSGQLFIVPKSNVKPINAKSADVMKFIISAGLTSWENNDTSN